ncbi:hypothetical protein THAOC_23378 [Thalassiosira oceanica]|uniref:Uncharacterized protein n=1 Tax=Thalassiosira oceanica TaxID=159749 RepID=K0RSE5_THAOC|nr:hypothetical protein THAOC_23378 [Thalassiosira oceanica]|eukprot:EJK56688.1 hypothetical protein THAOC_23378 [Thalassiosira oceanica]
MSGTEVQGKESVDWQRIDPPERDDVEARLPGHRTLRSLELKLQEQNNLHEMEMLKLKEAHKAEIEGLKAQGKESAREIRELKRKGTWQLTLEKTPEGYWTDREYSAGPYSEEYADSMRNLQGDIKDAVVKLREGGRDDLDDDDVLYIHLSFECDGIYQHAHHDDVMIPYWRELANALVHWSEFRARKGDRVGLILEYIVLPRKVRAILRPAIAVSKIRELGLYSVVPSHELKDFLGDIMLTNKYIRRLDLPNVRIESVEHIKPLTRAIKARLANGHHLDTLVLASCIGGGKLDILKEVSTCKIGSLFLDDNEIETECLAPITELIASNSPLTRLGLCDNNLKDADASSIADALKTNTRLDMIYLDGNELTEVGELALLKSTFDSDLNACSATNHICHVDGKESLCDVNYSLSSRRNRVSKYFTILTASSAENFYNMDILRNIPTPLMPRLLWMTRYCEWECLPYLTDNYLELSGGQRQDKHDAWDYDLNEDNRELNCMFEFVRSWTAPSLFA